MFNEELKERVFNTYKFSNHDNNKFILSLRKVVYPCACIDETSILEKEDFYSHLDMEDITDADYALAKELEIENLGEYHDL